jgi:hypothetical protein
MTATEIVAQLKELMEKYNEARTAWIARFGEPDGFDLWFTTQILDKR